VACPSWAPPATDRPCGPRHRTAWRGRARASRRTSRPI
jgi:hypothetical protein